MYSKLRKYVTVQLPEAPGGVIASPEGAKQSQKGIVSSLALLAMTARLLRKYIFSFVILLGLSLPSTCFANVLDNWQDQKAYKPKPVLFLHGFAKGNPNDWNTAKSSLGRYFSKYQAIGAYLEAIDFQDPNGSVDTYGIGKANPQGNPKGWSDKVEDKVNALLAFDKYGAYTNKLNLVCHSMGGLAGRWYLANYSNNFVDTLILIGVPNKGSNWARVANAASKVPKTGWLSVLTMTGYASILRDDLDNVLSTLGKIDVGGEAVKDLDITDAGSRFLDKLNNIKQSANINYYGVIGIVGNPMNWVISGHYFGGDCIVAKDSQLGAGKVSYKEWSEIHANHWREVEIAALETDNKILKFLDSTPPEFEITSPSPIQTTTIYASSVNIQGKAYKEYLPADTQLIINVTREEDNQSLPTQVSLLKGSDLWIPKNPDSPVAEFNEPINLPGNGTYKISCQLKNPSGLTSDTKDIWVKVIPAVTGIIVHCHNPEGKEINSIPGLTEGVEIFEGGNLIGYGADNAETHNKSIELTTGTHTIKAKFNGMTLQETVNLTEGQTKEIIFTFSRVEFDIEGWINSKNIKKEFSSTFTVGSWEIKEEHSYFSSIKISNRLWSNSNRPLTSTATIYNAFNYTGTSFRFKQDVRQTVTFTGEPYSEYYAREWHTGADARLDDPGVETDIPISGFPSPRNDFASWYTQKIIDGYFGGLYVVYGLKYNEQKEIISRSAFRLGGNYKNEYSLIRIPTNLNFIKAIVEVGAQSTSYRSAFTYFAGWRGDTAGTKEAHRNVTGTMIIKMSSVPYDLTGSAI